MGVKNLWMILKPFFKDFTFDRPLPHRTVAIDAFTVIYAYGHTYTADVFHIAAVYRLTVKLLRKGFIPIFIFDNQSSFLKRQTQSERRATTNFKELDTDATNQIAAFEFAYAQKPTVFRSKVDSFQQEMANLLQNSSESSAYDDVAPYVPASYTAYQNTFRRLKTENPHYPNLLIELSSFSSMQETKFVDWQKSRAAVDFSSQRQQQLFLKSENCDQNFDMDDYGNYPISRGNDQHIRQISLQNFEEQQTETGDKLQKLLADLNFQPPRAALETVLQEIDLADPDFEPPQKTFLGAKNSLKAMNDPFAFKLNSQKLEQVRQFLDMLSVPNFTAARNLEAEQVCAILTQKNVAEFAFSTDSDCLVFGARKLIQFQEEQVVIIEHQDLQAYGLNQVSLVFLSILLGSDFQDGIPFVGPVIAAEILAATGGIKDIQGLWQNLRQLQIFIESGAGSKFSKFGALRGRLIREKTELKDVGIRIVNEDIISLFLNNNILIEDCFQTQLYVNFDKQLKAIQRVNIEFLKFLAGNLVNNVGANQILSKLSLPADNNVLLDVIRFSRWQKQIWQQLVVQQKKERIVKFESERLIKAFQYLLNQQ
ncbi:DNA excision repair protein Rad2 [Spironucleus salmonicida]|uniref:DNA excision repair protein Rad2 n=1 Tax=Spironucleus salmonicida TaxID=348837 RepID=V6LNP6_9EUKA|nr:DNA excision repair protein Rad2 [Spironucleus salmonicida]|eukprot:EST45341.1 DNA excision repair protein Rad2 [Spironucleus salmonicida]